MKRQPFFSKTPSPQSQRGIATILIVVLIGVALTATAMSIMHSMRSTQEKSIAVHAATNAQTGAWTGVEAFRRYLMTLDSTALDTGLPTEINIALGEAGIAYGSMKATEVSVEDDGDRYKINATIINTLEAAHASAAVGVVYEVAKGDDCPGCVTISTALDFHDDLVMSGQITFNLPSGTKRNINVDGDVSMIHIANSSLGTLNSTGSVSLGSSLLVEEINSNDNVILVGGAKADKVTTRGMLITGNTAVTNPASCQPGSTVVPAPNFICHLNPNTSAPDTCTHVCLGSDAGAKIVWANGEVILGGSTGSTNANSLSEITIDPPGSANHGILRTKEEVTIKQTAVVQEVHTKGAVTIKNSPQVGTIIAEENLDCDPASWDKYANISLNGTVASTCTGPLAISNIVPQTKVRTNQSNTVDVMTEVPPFTTPKTVIDVWPLKQYANYVFEYDTQYSRTKVTVNKVHGVADGSVFWLANSAYLCVAGPGGNPNQSCTKATAPTLDMCTGYYSGAPCLQYDNGAWKLEGQSMPPGILWFKGSLGLHVSGAQINSTILATGNVTFLQGQIVINAVNYGGFSAICNPTGLYSDQIPSNLCNLDTSEYVSFNVGNIAIAAGGYDPNGDGITYSGGDINLGQNNTVFGSVLAGGYLTTDGQTVVNGFITAAVQGSKRSDGTKKNDLRGNTTIDLTKGNENFNPAIIPDMTDGSACLDCGESSGSTPGEVKVLWSKYL